MQGFLWKNSNIANVQTFARKLTNRVFISHTEKKNVKTKTYLKTDRFYFFNISS